MFAAGALAGGAAVLAAYLGWFEPAPAPTPLVERTFAVPATDPAPAGVAAVDPPAASAVPVGGTCPTQPLAQAQGSDDGQFALQAALATGASTDPSAFLTVAREAAEQGRVRDAEVALMAACHVAERSYGQPSAPVADIKSQMGQHYVVLAAQEGLATARDQLLQRASALFAESASTYAAALGKNASKTRLAERRLAALREPDPTLPPPTPLMVARPAPRAEPEAAPPTARLGAARSTSLAERPPLRSEDLGKVEQDLDRLYDQARAVSRDPAGVQRRHQQALAQRSACRGDAECLRGWYAERKRALFGEF